MCLLNLHLYVICFIFVKGTAVSVGLFSHILKIDDAIIGVLSSASKIISSFVYTFATVAWVFYLGK